MHIAQYAECVSLGRHEQASAFTRVIQPDHSQVEVCRHCGWVRSVGKDHPVAPVCWWEEDLGGDRCAKHGGSISECPNPAYNSLSAFVAMLGRTGGETE